MNIIILCLTLLISTPVFADPALSWKGYALGEDISNVHGGAKTGTIIIGAGALTALYDTQKAYWWRGGEFAFGILGIGQTHLPSDYTAAIQLPTGYAGVPEIRITDMAYQHTFSDRLMLRAGIMDIDEYFNYMQVAIPLLNSAFTNTAAFNYNIQLPTYPYPGFGAIAKLGPDNLALWLGVYQGNPQHQRTVFNRGQLLIAEFVSEFCSSQAKYVFKAGLWDYQQDLDYIGTTDHGIYFIGEASWKIRSGHKFGVGINLGFNPEKFDTVTDSVAACFTISKIFNCRPCDSLNFGVGRAWLNGAPKPETFYEIGYRVQFMSNLALTPDLQYFTHPTGIYPNALVLLLRLHYNI